MSKAEVEKEKKMIQSEIENLKSQIEKSMMAGIKIEDDLEVDGFGYAIQEEEEENDIVIDEKEVIELGQDSRQESQEANLLEESIVTDIVDSKTITKNFKDFQEMELPDPVLESIESPVTLKKVNLEESQIQEDFNFNESMIIDTKSKDQLSKDLPNFSQMDKNYSVPLNSNGMFDLSAKVALDKDKKQLEIPQASGRKNKESDGFSQSVIIGADYKPNNAASRKMDDDWGF